MKKVIYSLMLLLAVSMLSCKKDDTATIPNVNITIEGVTSTENLSLPQQGTLVLKAKVDNATNFAVTWSVNGKEVSKEVEYKFTATEMGENLISLVVENHDGGRAESILKMVQD